MSKKKKRQEDCRHTGAKVQVTPKKDHKLVIISCPDCGYYKEKKEPYK